MAGYDFLKEHKESLIIVSNRVPFNFFKTEKGISYKQSISGLVTALDPIMAIKGGTWIGWSGLSSRSKFLNEQVKFEVNSYRDYEIKFVSLNEKDINLFYQGFTNRTLWPLLHGFIFQSHFSSEFWESYLTANKKYAKAVLEELQENELVWVQDYHLMLVPEMIRARKPDARIVFFLHIPFPNIEIFRALPWHKQILNGVLGSDLAGFQTKNDASNFIYCCKDLLGYKIGPDDESVHIGGRKTGIKNFPISIDYEGFVELSKSKPTQKMFKSIKKSTKNTRIVLSVERLDYTKGIKERLYAISKFFEKYPEYKKKVVFIQISVPSRTKISEYIRFKNEIDELVGKINGRFAEELWTPVIYIYKALTQDKLAAYYEASDVCLVTPLRDGMNLIAKEYVTCKSDNDGALILSDFAGCADELRNYSFMVNPYDADAIADTLDMVFNLTSSERKWRLKNLKRIVRKKNVFAWARDFLGYFYKLRRETIVDEKVKACT